ncbi:hypothetical protein D3C73_817610 [compost metagenome]
MVCIISIVSIVRKNSITVIAVTNRNFIRRNWSRLLFCKIADLVQIAANNQRSIAEITVRIVCYRTLQLSLLIIGHIYI